MISQIHKDAETKMKKSVESLHNDLTKLRTGRAHISLLEHIKVPYYGTDTPLSQVSTVVITDARTFTVTPYEKSLTSAIEKAIRSSELGLNPVTTGNALRIPLPALTQERRTELTKILRGEVENARVAVRNIRRDANTQLKDQLKKKTISEDEEKSAQDQIQKLTDKFIAEIDKILAGKEQELMQV
jgi:ribosome recycling factor